MEEDKQANPQGTHDTLEGDEVTGTEEGDGWF